MQKVKKEQLKNGIIILLVLIIAGGCWIIYRHHFSAKPQAEPAVATFAVSAVRPQQQDITVTRSYIGRVEAIHHVQIVPYLSGYISKVLVSGGQEVKKNQVLLTIRPEEYEAALTSAYAGVLSSAADLRNAESQYQRLQKAGPKAVSQTEMDNAETAVLTAEAAVKQAESTFRNAQINLEYTLIRAPFDGVLGNLSASVGDFITPSSDSLVKIVQYNPIRVVFSLTDKEFLRQPDLKTDVVRLQLADGSAYPQAGRIAYTANEIVESTNTLAVYAEFANPQKLLLPNAYVKVLLEHLYKNVVVIPKNLLQMGENGYFVYTINSGILQSKPVKVIAEEGDNYLLANDFTEAEVLVTDVVEPQLIGHKVTAVFAATKEE